MNILLHTAIALQAPQMVGSVIKMGSFLGGSAPRDKSSCTKLIIEKMQLFERFERFVPSFFSPDLKFFLLTITWDDQGNFSVSPEGNSTAPFQFIFGKKNSRRLKSNQLNLLSKPMHGRVNLLAWGMEIESGRRFEDIDCQKVARLIETSSFRELLAKASRDQKQVAPAVFSRQLLKLQHTLPQKIPFIAALHPILEFSSQEARRYTRRNEYGEVCLKMEN